MEQEGMRDKPFLALPGARSLVEAIGKTKPDQVVHSKKQDIPSPG